MNLIMNFGNPRKPSFRSIAEALLGEAECINLPITGVDVFRSSTLAVTSPAYGSGMVLDALTEAVINGILGSSDCVVFVGSMGSCSGRINLGDLVLPNPCLCAYYGFDGIELTQNDRVLTSLHTALREQNRTATEYLHGSSFAVFDPHTDHEAYKINLYGGMVEGVDCAEVYVGLDFAQKQGISAGVLLYCSDSPLKRIRDIPPEEFSARAAEGDLIMNRTAARAISIWQTA